MHQRPVRKVGPKPRRYRSWRAGALMRGMRIATAIEKSGRSYLWITMTAEKISVTHV